MPNVMTLSKMQTLLFAAALLCIFLTNLSCNNNVSITTEETPQKRIIASCDNGLLKKSNCIDTDDGTTEEEEEEPTPTPTVTPTATATPTATPTPAPPQFIDVSTGEGHSCGLTSEGKAYCWGSDGWAELGNGAISGNKIWPVAVDTSSMTGEKAFIKLISGRRHNCGLTGEGVIWCWGRDAAGQLGNGAALTGNQSLPSAVDTSGMTGIKSFVDVSSSFYDTTCGLTTEGKAWCWGSIPVQTAPTLVDTSGMTGDKAFTKVSAGMYHICGITAEGKAWCWGDDGDGRLGNGAVTGTQTAPSAVDISGMTGDKNFSDISAGGNYTCALTNEGKAWCWGDDAGYQLGNGAATTADQTTPSAVDISAMTGVKRFSSITAGIITCGITTESKAWCWGADYDGGDYILLGNGAALTADQPSPSPIDTSVMTGELAIKKISPPQYGTHGCLVTSEGKVWCWGDDSGGKLGNGTLSGVKYSPSPVDTAGLSTEKTFTKISGTYTSTCAINAAGKLACWGDGDANFANNGATDLASPALFDTSALTGDKIFSDVVSGVWRTCGITTDGNVWCKAHGSTPALLDTSAIASEKTFVKLSMLYHGCGIASDGKAWCWGADGQGQLGNGAGITGTQTGASAVDTSTMTGSTTFIDIATGLYHSCGIATEGKLYCWGYDNNGQLGNGAGVTGNQVSPSAVDTSGMTGEKAFAQITASQEYTCALTAEGKAWCWGQYLGTVPAAVDTSAMTGDKSFKKIAAGTFHVCAITSQGKVWCWGEDTEGQLGNGAALTGYKVAPSPLDTASLSGETAFQDITSGWSHSCALTSQGKAWCWGSEDDGALGNGGSKFETVVSPVAVDDSGI